MKTFRRVFLGGAALAAAWALASLFGMAYGVLVVWPDFVHVNYGFPLTYAVHTLNTFIGPVDKWTLDLPSLVIDLSFWSFGMLVIIIGLVFYQRRSASARGPMSA
jgi:hypothetical protein